MRTRSVSAILVWVAIVLLLLNVYSESSWLFLTSIALVIIALVVYFLPRQRK